jgi:hypothetical protein
MELRRTAKPELLQGERVIQETPKSDFLPAERKQYMYLKASPVQLQREKVVQEILKIGYPLILREQRSHPWPALLPSRPPNPVGEVGRRTEIE